MFVKICREALVVIFLNCSSHSHYTPPQQGPAGSGKSTYCQVMQEHCATLSGSRRRNVLVVNLDPAAENINYECAIDVRDLISVEDVMEELGLGPNGGLMYCMEYLLNNLSWLQEQMEPQGCDGDMHDYWLVDCPGQIELYTHVPIMRTILDRMQHQWGFTPGWYVKIDSWEVLYNYLYHPLPF